jgi:hypothetical protein
MMAKTAPGSTVAPPNETIVFVDSTLDITEEELKIVCSLWNALESVAGDFNQRPDLDPGPLKGRSWANGARDSRVSNSPNLASGGIYCAIYGNADIRPSPEGIRSAVNDFARIFGMVRKHPVRAFSSSDMTTIFSGRYLGWSTLWPTAKCNSASSASDLFVCLDAG